MHPHTRQTSDIAPRTDVDPSRLEIRERFARARGHRGLLREVGHDGPPVVIMASTLVVARSYDGTARELAARGFRVTVVEPPGAGRASRLDEPWGLEEFADWLLELLDALGTGPVTLVGHSNSGAVALIAAARSPEVVSRIVLSDTVGVACDNPLRRILLMRGWDCLLELELSMSAWYEVLLNPVYHWRNFFRQVLSAGRDDLGPYASRVRVPTLLAWGSRDHTTPLRCAHALRELMPHASLYISRSGSHDWIVERPGEFATAFSRLAM